MTRPAAFLKASSDSLFGWCAPARPEDLRFVDAAGVALLETVSHERSGALRLSEADWEAWNRHPLLGGDWRWRDVSKTIDRARTRTAGLGKTDRMMPCLWRQTRHSP